MIKSMTVAAVLVAASGVGLGQTAGDIVFTTEDGGVFSLPQGGSASLLTTLGGGLISLSDLTFGPNGDLFVNNGPRPVGNPSDSGIFRIADPFGAATSSVLAASGNIQNPIGVAYNRASNTLLTVNNPGTATPLPSDVFLGLLGTNATTGATNIVFEQEPAGTAFPYYNRGAFITPTPGLANTYYSAAVEGSNFQYAGQFPQTRASSLHRFDFDPNTGTATEELVIDLGDTAATGFSRSIGRVTGVTAVDEQTIFLTGWDFLSPAVGTIYRVDLDTNGDFVSITDITDGNLGGVRILPEELEYNPYTGKLVFANNIVNSQGEAHIYELNLDGTGLNSIYFGEAASGIEIVPAPGGLALLGLGGLAAARRRR